MGNRTGKEEERGDRERGGEERGGIGKISKQISDWARHNSDFHVCLPSDPSGLVSFGVMFKLLNYAREIRVHTAPDGGKGRPDYSEGFSLFRGSSFFFPELSARVTSRISISVLFTDRCRLTSRRTTSDVDSCQEIIDDFSIISMNVEILFCRNQWRYLIMQDIFEKSRCYIK